MNTLLVDAGNSRLKWALCRAGQWQQRGDFRYDEAHLPSQLGAQWTALPLAEPARLVLSNVAGPKVEQDIGRWAQGLQESPAMTIETVVAQKHGFGVRCAYPRPQRLGTDRWAGLVAAHHYVDGACCIIDAGSALTIDVLAADGAHLGGVIIPGRAMMRQGLRAETAQVDVGAASQHNLFSVADTADAVQAGIMAATQGAVTHVLGQCRDLGLEPLSCVLTGGDAPALLPVMPQETRVEPWWVLKGLAVIAGCHQ